MLVGPGGLLRGGHGGDAPMVFTSFPSPQPSPGGRGSRLRCFGGLHRPEKSSRTQVLNSTQIGSLSPSPPWGRGLG
ncbi:hypothetical protein PDR5_30840 [Pseudomonas sp. DR 5-09]|nr:hypothetical protein PDR5_30840 [Pseudomonas sp. DR 5-09]